MVQLLLCLHYSQQVQVGCCMTEAHPATKCHC